MNAMGHDVPTMIGVDHRKVAREITNVIPDYMVMGERGMADMGEMEMPLPDHTLPMMGGQGPFGSAEMGGMFTLMKVRSGQKPGDYRDPGWFKAPAGTRAWEFTGELPSPSRAAPASGKADIELNIRKPSGHEGHH
jgi:hypothetical protein